MSEKVKSIRYNLELSQPELSKVLDVGKANISFWERNPNAKISVKFQKRIDELYNLVQTDIEAAKKFVEDKLSS